MPPLVAAALIVFLEGLAFGVILPVLTPFTQSLGGNETWAGILFAAATLPRVFFAPIWGRLSDRRGRRPVMAMVAGGTAVASMMWGFCTDLDGFLMPGLMWLLASRLIYGSFAAQSVLGMAVASDVSTPAKRAAAMGVLGAAFGLAFTLGPALGGTFSHHIGMAHVGFLAGGIQLLSLLIVLTRLRETLPSDPALAARHDIYADPRSALHLISLRSVATLMIVAILSTAAYSVLFPTITPLAGDWYHWTEWEVGIALSVFGFIGALVQGGLIRPMSRRLGNKITAIVGLVLTAAGLAWVASHPLDTAGFWAALSILAVGTGLSVPTITAMMSLSVNERDQGTVHGLNQSATSIGRSAGFLASGFIFESVSRAATYQVGAAAAAVSLLILLMIPEPARTDKQAAAGEAAMDESQV